MTYRTFHVSHSKDGFQIHFTERSVFRDGVMKVMDWIDEISRHRLCNRAPYNRIWHWAESGEIHLDSIPATRDMVRPLQWGPDDWSYLDDEDDDTNE